MTRRSLLVLAFMTGIVKAEQEIPENQYKNESLHFTVLAPENWSLFPEEDLPQEIQALFYQVGEGGEPTGANVSVRTFEDQVHSELDFIEFVGLYQLNIRSLGLDMDQITRREYGAGSQKRISLEYTLTEEEDLQVWYKQMFYQVGDNDVLLLSGKDAWEHRDASVQDFNQIFDLVQIEGRVQPTETPEPLDLPTPKP